MSGDQQAQTSRRFLLAEEVSRLRRSSEDRYLGGLKRGAFVPVRDYVAIMLLLLGGLRVSGAASLTVAQLQLNAKHPAILPRLKGGGYGRVLIPKVLRDLLREWLDYRRKRGETITDESPVLPSIRGGAISRWGLNHVWKKALDRAGLDTHFGTHAARHSYGTEVYRQTRDLRLTQVQLCHRSSRTTEVYTHVLDEDRAKAAEAIFSEE